MHHFASLIFGIASTLTVFSADAQAVYKCTQNGQAVYQASPCPHGTGKPVPISAGPTEQQKQDALQRAADENSRAKSSLPTAETKQTSNREAQPKYDCATLNQQRAEAFGRRNGALRFSRGTGMDSSAGVNEEHRKIIAIEAKMRESGCAPK